MAEKYKIVACPTCGKEVEWRPENKWRPFCGERCKMIDLGEWATEKYKVPVVEQSEFNDLEPRG
jgi:hypothetical protein